MSNFNLKLKKIKNLVIGCFQLCKTSEKTKLTKIFAQYCILTQFFQSSDFFQIYFFFENSSDFWEKASGSSAMEHYSNHTTKKH